MANMRSRQPTVFAAIRAIVAAFKINDPHLGLHGASGYYPTFQFEPDTAPEPDCIRHRAETGPEIASISGRAC